MDVYHYLQILLLGVVEGITEFLPISSTGHLLLTEDLLGSHMSDFFNVVIQAGAILAATVIYWPRVAQITNQLHDSAVRSYALKIVVAILITCILAFIIRNHKLPEKIEPVAWATLIGGFVILAVEYLASGILPRDEVSWVEAVAMGVGQVIAALFPGASRSGTTIMIGMILGLRRPAATEFSFLIGIPTMFIASAFEFIKLALLYHKGDKSVLSGETLQQVLLDTGIGFVIATIVAFFAVKWLLVFVQSNTFNGFAVYRIILGVGLLVALSANFLVDPTDDDEGKGKTPETTPTITNPAPPLQTNQPSPLPSPLPPDTNQAVPALPVLPSPTPEPTPTPSPTPTPTRTPTPTPTRRHRHTPTPTPA